MARATSNGRRRFFPGGPRPGEATPRPGLADDTMSGPPSRRCRRQCAAAGQGLSPPLRLKSKVTFTFCDELELTMFLPVPAMTSLALISWRSTSAPRETTAGSDMRAPPRRFHETHQHAEPVREAVFAKCIRTFARRLQAGRTGPKSSRSCRASVSPAAHPATRRNTLAACPPMSWYAHPERRQNASSRTL